MQKPQFKHLEDRSGNPLIIWCNPPGLDVELTPSQARNLAASLIATADYSERKHYAKSME